MLAAEFSRVPVSFLRICERSNTYSTDCFTHQMPGLSPPAYAGSPLVAEENRPAPATRLQTALSLTRRKAVRNTDLMKGQRSW